MTVPSHPRPVAIVDDRDSSSSSDAERNGVRGGGGWGAGGGAGGGAGVVRLEPASSERERQLWRDLEGVMAARQSQVLQVLEEFGVGDVPPSTDPLEEQVWRVVQGELTMQEAAELV